MNTNSRKLLNKYKRVRKQLDQGDNSSSDECEQSVNGGFQSCYNDLEMCVSINNSDSEKTNFSLDGVFIVKGLAALSVLFFLQIYDFILIPQSISV